ncbi:hypothetical protein KR018_008194 [Drosophila ironensis]|nr:hypothetical protein KR018_008194 [Drosophila ironensis]
MFRQTSWALSRYAQARCRTSNCCTRPIRGLWSLHHHLAKIDKRLMAFPKPETDNPQAWLKLQSSRIWLPGGRTTTCRLFSSGDDDDVEEKCMEKFWEKRCKHRAMKKKCGELKFADKCKKRAELEHCLKCQKLGRGEKVSEEGKKKKEKKKKKKKKKKEEVSEAEQIAKLTKQCQAMADQMECEKEAKIEAMKQACRMQQLREACEKFAAEEKKRRDEERRRAEEAAREKRIKAAAKMSEEEIKRAWERLSQEAKCKAHNAQKRLKEAAEMARVRMAVAKCRKVVEMEACRVAAKKAKEEEMRKDCERREREAAEKEKAAGAAALAAERARCEREAQEEMCLALEERLRAEKRERARPPKKEAVEGGGAEIHELCRQIELEDACANYDPCAEMANRKTDRMCTELALKKHCEKLKREEICAKISTQPVKQMQTPPPPPPPPTKTPQQVAAEKRKASLMQICKTLTQKKLKIRKKKTLALKKKCKKMAELQQCKCAREKRRRQKLEAFCIKFRADKKKAKEAKSKK